MDKKFTAVSDNVRVVLKEKLAQHPVMKERSERISKQNEIKTKFAEIAELSK